MKELAVALSKAQSEMTTASKDARNPHFGSSYATLASVWDALREPLTRNGLSIVQTGDFDETGPILVTTLLHSSGESMLSRLRILNPKNDMQGLGSAWTYARRYALQAIAGIAPDDDDDGNAATVRSQPVKAVVNPLKELRQNKVASTEDPGEYVIGFGQFKGMKISEVDIFKLNDYVNFIQGKAEQEGKPISGQVAQFMTAANLFLSMRDVRNKLKDSLFDEEPEGDK
jgi:hypothetical protein